MGEYVQPKAMFEEQDCITCGVRFGVPFGYTDNHRKNKERFYCPNGHAMSYTESEADKLRRERDRLKQENARLEEEKQLAWRAENAQKERADAAVKREKRLLKRAAAGAACPCCNRNFANLARHIAAKHPTFEPGVSAQVVSLKPKK